MGLQLRTWFIQHLNSLLLCSDKWCVWFPYLHHFTCWTCLCVFPPSLLTLHCSNTFVRYTWNIYLELLLLSIWIHVMMDLSDTSSVLDIFMDITGLLKRAWFHTKQYTPHYCQESITSKFNLCASFEIVNIIDWNTRCNFWGEMIKY